MLSKKDLIKELGKNILVEPYKSENLKENSYNLTISKYAWASGKSIYKEDTKKIVLPPHEVAFVYSEEVIHVGNNLGGAVHSKVGIVANGIGHIGTMFGPNYKGRFLINLHNITDNEIELNVGDTFCSLTFDYLKTKWKKGNKTSSGHVDKLNKWNFPVVDFPDYEKDLTDDWVKDWDKVKAKMFTNANYINDVDIKRKKAKNLVIIIGLWLLALILTGIIVVGIFKENKGINWEQIGRIVLSFVIPAITYICGRLKE